MISYKGLGPRCGRSQSSPPPSIRRRDTTQLDSASTQHGQKLHTYTALELQRNNHPSFEEPVRTFLPHHSTAAFSSRLGAAKLYRTTEHRNIINTPRPRPLASFSSASSSQRSHDLARKTIFHRGKGLPQLPPPSPGPANSPDAHQMVRVTADLFRSIIFPLCECLPAVWYAGGMRT